MFKRQLGMLLSMALAVPFAAAANPAPATAKLSAAEIVEKNVAARGGLQAWHAVQTMQWTGKMGVGGNQRATLAVPDPAQKASQKLTPSRPTEEVQLPFTMDLKRSRKMRFELEFHGKTAVQVFDGANGWKLRPFLNRLEVEPYTADERTAAAEQSDLDGPLVDYAAKGTRVALDGMEKVEGRDTYNLVLTMKDGQTKHVWIDAQTFLETKMEGQPRRLDGVMHPVEVYFRDYRQVDGLQIPYVLETKVLPVAKTAAGLRDVPVPAEKIVIDKVTVNPKFADSLFTKPEVTAASNTVKKPAHVNN
jgi:hypothetical protein